MAAPTYQMERLNLADQHWLTDGTSVKYVGVVKYGLREDGRPGPAMASPRFDTPDEVKTWLTLEGTTFVNNYPDEKPVFDGIVRITSVEMIEIAIDYTDTE